jgi:hypothetical protein
MGTKAHGRAGSEAATGAVVTAARPSKSKTARASSTPSALGLSPDCDLAIRLLMLTLAQHRRSESLLAVRSPVRGRLKVLPPDSVNSRIRCESVLVRSVSIMESYVHRQLASRLATLAPPPRSGLVEQLYADFEEKGITSWAQTDVYFKEHVDRSIKIKTYGSWNQVSAVIEARNAVVHGLGAFTARQTRRQVPQKVDTHLKALRFDISPDRRRVLVTQGAVEETAILLRRYLGWLDDLISAVP